MNNTTDHIFTPKDSSLEARIEAFRNVYEAWQNAEASMKFADDNGWKDTLGSKEEIQEALNISTRSLHLATSTFSKEEIRQAQKNNLLQTHEVQKIVSTQRQGEMQSAREQSSQASDSSEQSQKR